MQADQGAPGAPLAGVVVCDLSRVLTGPYATMMMGDMGARIIKVERPGAGDDTRAWGPPFVGPAGDQQSTYFLSTNRNKESITLDFKDEGDRATLERLVRHSDVLVENFRAGVLDKLGLSMERLHELNPRLVILSITGFGHDGPEAHRAGYDQILQGEAGLMSLTGPDPDTPTKVGVSISDILAGMFGAYGVVAALFDRERTGRGCVVRTSLLAATVGVHAFQGTRWLIAGEVPEPLGNRHPTVSAYGAYQCADGIVQVGAGSAALWERFAGLVGIDPQDPRFLTNGDRLTNSDELDRLIAEHLAPEPITHWLEIFGASGIPVGEVKSLNRVYDSEQVASQGMIVEAQHPTLGTIRLPGPPVRFDGDPGREHSAPPTLGQHSEAIMSWLEERDSAAGSAQG